MTDQVWYHGDMDGLCAAWIYWRHHPEWTYIPVQYGQPHPPVSQGDFLWIVDFSYPKDVMDELRSICGTVTVFDHHKTCEIQEEDYCIFDVNKSGARLVWENVKAVRSIDWRVEYTEDRDFWRWRLPGSREINAGFQVMDFTFEALDRIEKEEAFSNGSIVLKYQKQLIDSAVSKAVMCDVAGYMVPCVNTTVCTSEIGQELAARSPLGWGATFFIRSDGKRVYSLRSVNGVDVSEIAKSMGGGGHPAAAGFEV